MKEFLRRLFMAKYRSPSEISADYRAKGLCSECGKKTKQTTCNECVRKDKTQ